MRLFFEVLLLLALFCLINCEKNPVVPEKKDSYSLFYEVSIPSIPCDTVAVTLHLKNTEPHGIVRLLVLPMYADNPFLVETAPNFHHCFISDSLNNDIPYSLDTLWWNEYSVRSLVFTAPQTSVTLTYQVTFQYAQNQIHDFMPIPNIADTGGYLQGNYLYLIPYEAASTAPADIWRQNLDITVVYKRADAVNIFGDPDTVVFRTPYELLFSTSAVLSDYIVNERILAQGEACGQTFRFVSISPSLHLSSDLIKQTKNNFITILNDIIPLFGHFGDIPFTIITGINNTIGLEGMYAFCLNNRWDDADKLNYVMAHEYMHNWIGIRCGEYADPWWKEGTATYCGLLIAKRNNLCSKNYIKKMLLDSFPDNDKIDEAVLSDQHIRTSLYLDKKIGHIVYRKGAQINMLLDRYIREKTHNAATLVKALAEFTQLVEQKAFYRHEYVSFLAKKSDNKIQTIFSAYVDRPGRVCDSVLQNNFNFLDSIGAFGD